MHHAMAVEISAVWPCVFILLMVGLGTSILQAVLQIEDATFALLPKTMVMILLAFTGAFGALGMFESLAKSFITHAPALVRQAWY